MNAMPGIFWYWNADPTPNGIRRQLTQIRAAGFRSVYLHPMPDNFRKSDFKSGMKMRYLGRKFFRLARTAVDECRRLGLRFMIYDEGGWPSGTANGELVKRRPEFGIHVLERRADGSIAPRNAGIDCGYPDLMNARATKLFLTLVHERYRRELGDEFGRTIGGIFTDEPRFFGELGSDAVPWSPCLPEHYRNRYGSDVEEIYPLLFQLPEVTAEAEAARRRYLEAYATLTAESYYGVISGWCRRHGLPFEGHMNNEDLHSLHAASLGDFLRCADRFDVPGVDAIWRQIHPESGNGNYAKLASSSAIRNHRKEALSESFNVYGNGVTGQTMYWAGNAQLVRGINRLLPMPFPYSDRREAKVGCATELSPRNPVWNALPALTAHWTWAGNYDTGAIEPEVWIFYRPEPFSDKAAASAFDAMLEALQEKLNDAFVFWRFAGVDDLAAATSKKLLIVPGEPMLPEQRRAIAGFAAAGNPVVRHPAEPLPDLAQYACICAGTERGIRVLPCRRPEGESLMIFNESAERKLLAFRPRAGECWRELAPPDPVHAELEPFRASETKCELPLVPGELRILTTGKAVPPSPAESAEAKPTHLNWIVRSVLRSRIGEHITCRREPHSPVPLPASGDFTECEPDFSGVIELETEFNAAEPMPRYLEFDWVAASAELFVNGRSAGLRAFAPWIFRLSPLRPGRNRLKLVVSNPLGNEWRARYPEMKRTGQTNSYAERIAGFTPDETRIGVSPAAKLYL